ncbi:MAG: TIR domain-containing protein, partial [Roseovarius sp.]
SSRAQSAGCSNNSCGANKAGWVEKLCLMTKHTPPNHLRESQEFRWGLEKYSDVGFAVILMTGDDLGASLADAELQNFTTRARQNVILELGYFVAKLSRERTCVLKSEGVEAPSDIMGVVYTEIDRAGAWRITLGKELRACGYDVDLNKL